MIGPFPLWGREPIESKRTPGADRGLRSSQAYPLIALITLITNRRTHRQRGLDRRARFVVVGAQLARPAVAASIFAISAGVS